MRVTFRRVTGVEVLIQIGLRNFVVRQQFGQRLNVALLHYVQVVFRLPVEEFFRHISVVTVVHFAASFTDILLNSFQHLEFILHLAHKTRCNCLFRCQTAGTGVIRPLANIFRIEYFIRRAAIRMFPFGQLEPSVQKVIAA